MKSLNLNTAYDDVNDLFLKLKNSKLEIVLDPQ